MGEINMSKLTNNEVIKLVNMTLDPIMKNEGFSRSGRIYYKKVNNEIGKYIGIFLCVMTFILCGFEHCVANMVYFTIASSWSTNTLLYLAIMILGNSFGSILIAFFYNLYYKN